MSFEFDTQIYEDRIYRPLPGILFLKAKTGILADPVTVDLTREKNEKPYSPKDAGKNILKRG